MTNALAYYEIGSLNLYQDVGHRHALVEDPKLSPGSIGGLGVDEDPAVLNGPVNVGNHGADVAEAVRLRSGLLRFDVLLNGRLPFALKTLDNIEKILSGFFLPLSATVARLKLLTLG